MQVFVEEGLQQIDIGDDLFVKIPKSISFDDLTGISMGDDLTEMGKAKSLLVSVIKEWNFKLADGTQAPINAETIGKLTMPVISKIMTVIRPLVSIEKKD